MRIWILWMAALSLFALLPGCVFKGGSSEPSAKRTVRTQSQPIPSADKPVVRLANDVTGRVQRVNPNGKFAVLTFPVGQLPRFEQRMGVYRQNLKVGEIKITGPQMDDSVVADIIAGECSEGDIVRE